MNGNRHDTSTRSSAIHGSRLKAVAADGLARRLLLGLLALLVATLQAPIALALVDGTSLASIERETGIVQIWSYDSTVSIAVCTATVLYSSVETQETWLVTAGHCFSYDGPLWWITGHFSQPRAEVMDGYSVDFSAPNSTVYIHPEWLRASTSGAWFGPHDIALVHYDSAIPIFDSEGDRIDEFRRPIYTGPPNAVAEPNSSISMENFASDVFCGQSDAELRCDTLSNIWWSPNFMNTYLQIPNGAWKSGFFVGGDSGGPLLKYAPGLVRRWEGVPNIERVVRYGVVMGVLSRPTIFCDYIQNGNCNPADALVTDFQYLNSWLDTIPGTELIPQITTWSFAGMFVAGIGTPTDLTSQYEVDYTLPAYTGRLVGVGVDRTTDQVYSWYDNDRLTIGNERDLDKYSQFSTPGYEDLVPTLNFKPASGKQAVDIVAMMIDHAGVVWTWYLNGTHSSGTPEDLDANTSPRSYYLPPGKTPQDIVAIAARPGYGLYAYYSDGTVSEGYPRDLDYYMRPTPFVTGNGRRPEEIADSGTFSDGSILTLFEHPSLFMVVPEPSGGILGLTALATLSGLARRRASLVYLRHL